MCIRDRQSGGRPGVGTDFACLAVRMQLHLHASRGRSAVVVFLDLAATFYSIVRQVVLSLPSDQEQFSRA
eukprot:6350102-Pyramimonas_sp.AAC.1